MHQKMTGQDVKVIEAVASIRFGAEEIQDVMSNLHEEKEEWLERVSRTQRTFTFKRCKDIKKTKTGCKNRWREMTEEFWEAGYA